MKDNMTFTSVVKKILTTALRPMTPQEISAVIKSDYSQYYGTPSHTRNVKNGNYKTIYNALLAQIYSLVHTNKSFNCDKTSKPMKISIGNYHDEPRVQSTPTLKSITKSTTHNPKHHHAMIEKPSADLLSQYLKKWEELENFKLQERSLNLLFKELCPENKKIEHVLLKVSTLNDFYSTNIFNTYTVANHILQQNVDLRLKANDYSLVNAIASISIKGKMRYFYSFASKYCSHHKLHSFPIYDSFVKKMLLHYMKSDGFDVFTENDLKTYKRFVEIIKKFQSFYELKEFSLRQIDIFLWLAGKEFFPKNYKKSNAIVGESGK